MAITVKSLFDGQLPAAKTTLYTAPGQAKVEGLTLVNTSTTATITANVYLKRSGGTSRRIAPRDLVLAPQALYEVCPKNLALGDEIEGDASSATTVDYVGTGWERT